MRWLVPPASHPRCNVALAMFQLVSVPASSSRMKHCPLPTSRVSSLKWSKDSKSQLNSFSCSYSGGQDSKGWIARLALDDCTLGREVTAYGPVVPTGNVTLNYLIGRQSRHPNRQSPSSSGGNSAFICVESRDVRPPRNCQCLPKLRDYFPSSEVPQFHLPKLQCFGKC